MKIAQFFIMLGIKGNDDTKKKLGGVKEGLGDVKSMSLEAKAGILAVVYGLQQLMSKSAQAGSDLAQFSAATGLSAETLQRWQYAGRQFNVGADEITSSVKSVQDAMTNMLLTGQAPEGMDIIAGTLGDFDMSKVRDSFYVMDKLQQYAQKSGADDASKRFLKGFGLSEGTIAAMRKNAFNPEAFAKASIYTDGQAESLRKINVGWANMGDKIEKSLGKLNAKHGGQLLKDMDMILDKVLKLTDAFLKLADSLKVFKLIGMVFEGWGKILDGANNIATDLKKGEYAHPGGPVAGLLNSFLMGAGDVAKGAYISMTEDQDQYKPRVPGKSDGKTNNVTIQQNLNFQHDGKNASAVGRSAAKGAAHAVRTSTANSGGQ